MQKHKVDKKVDFVRILTVTDGVASMTVDKGRFVQILQWMRSFALIRSLLHEPVHVSVPGMHSKANPWQMQCNLHATCQKILIIYLDFCIKMFQVM